MGQTLVRREATLISGAIRRAATLVNGGIQTFVLHFQVSLSMARSALMSVNRGVKFISGATERLTGDGDTALLILSIKRGSANKVTVTTLSLETAKDMYPAATEDLFFSSVYQLSTLTTSYSRVHSRRMHGVSGSQMNCNKCVTQMCYKCVFLRC